MQKLLVFNTLQGARDYRYEHGTGGWIFESDDDLTAILFPPDVYPTSIFNHPITKGRSGNLIGNA